MNRALLTPSPICWKFAIAKLHRSLCYNWLYCNLTVCFCYFSKRPEGTKHTGDATFATSAWSVLPLSLKQVRHSVSAPKDTSIPLTRAVESPLKSPPTSRSNFGCQLIITKLRVIWCVRRWLCTRCMTWLVICSPCTWRRWWWESDTTSTAATTAPGSWNQTQMWGFMRTTKWCCCNTSQLGWPDNGLKL